MVKLLSPVTSYESAVKVVSAGADEIYCGVKVPKVSYSGLSTRSPRSSLYTYDELEKVVKHAHSHGVKVAVTTEFPFLSKVIEKSIRSHIISCIERGVDSIIAGDLGIILMIKKEGLDIPVFASTYIASLNYETVNFLRDLDVKRVILERHMTIEEIQEIVQRNKDIEIEVFCHGPGCSNINVNCYFCFVPDSLMEPFKGDTLKEEFRPYALNPDQRIVRVISSPTCMVKYRVYEVIDDKMVERGFWPILDAYTFCSLCELPRLVKTGVTGLKIVGRELPLAYQESTTRIYRELLDLLGQDRPDLFQTRLASMISSKNDVVWPRYLYACEKKRCYYAPLFHAPYKLPTP